MSVSPLGVREAHGRFRCTINEPEARIEARGGTRGEARVGCANGCERASKQVFHTSADPPRLIVSGQTPRVSRWSAPIRSVELVAAEI
jgi:hypothetical protein